jgi:hypothetical protein
VAVGLPGTGIGGLFYMLLGAVMPLRRGLRALRHRPGAKSSASMRVTLALLAGIVATMWGQAWLLGELIEAIRAKTGATGASGAIAVLTGPTAAVYLKWAGIAGLLGLGLVFCIVHLLRILIRRPAPGDLPIARDVPAGMRRRSTRALGSTRSALPRVCPSASIASSSASSRSAPPAAPRSSSPTTP